MKPPVAPERDKLTQAIIKGTRHPVGWRRPRILPSPADLGDTPEWLREHVAATRAGSYLIGCPHMADGDVTDRRLAIFTVLPSVAVHASKMLAADTPITVITEGRAYDPTGADMDDEGMVLAAAVDRASDEYPNSVVEFDTWDDDPVNPYDKASPVWERLKAATGDIHLARAAIAIRMMAIGVDPDELVDVDILDDQSKIKVEQLLERDLPDTLNKSMRNKMRRMAFPHEFDEEEPTLVSAVGDLYDSMRQSNILRKIHEVEADGGVALVMATPYHAYSLKPVIVKQAEQKKNKSNSDPNMEAVDKGPEQGRSHTPGTARTADLEMAWGFNARVAAKISEIMAGINPKVTSGAKSVTPRLKRADPAKGMWTFHVPGSKGEKYIVRVKGLPKGNQKLLSGMDVRVSCTCPFFRWQGPEHWAKAGDYLYGKPVGNASRPDQKDPDARNRVCKHAVAAFRMAERYRAGSDGG